MRNFCRITFYAQNGNLALKLRSKRRFGLAQLGRIDSLPAALSQIALLSVNCVAKNSTFTSVGTALALTLALALHLTLATVCGLVTVLQLFVAGYQPAQRLRHAPPPLPEDRSHRHR